MLLRLILEAVTPLCMNYIYIDRYHKTNGVYTKIQMEVH